MSNIPARIRGGGWHTFKKYLPKKYLVEHFYRKKSGGRKINLKNPERFSDKLGWYDYYGAAEPPRNNQAHFFHQFWVYSV